MTLMNNPLQTDKVRWFTLSTVIIHYSPSNRQCTLGGKKKGDGWWLMNSANGSTATVRDALSVMFSIKPRELLFFCSIAAGTMQGCIFSLTIDKKKKKSKSRGFTFIFVTAVQIDVRNPALKFYVFTWNAREMLTFRFTKGWGVLKTSLHLSDRPEWNFWQWDSRETQLGAILAETWPQTLHTHTHKHTQAAILFYLVDALYQLGFPHQAWRSLAFSPDKSAVPQVVCRWLID